MRDLDVSFRHRDEAAVGQRREHVLHVARALQVELGKWSAAAHRLVARSLADQAQHDCAHDRLALIGDARVCALGQPGNGTVDAAGLTVGGQGERACLPLLPELEEGGGQQRSAPGSPSTSSTSASASSGSTAQPHTAGGQLDGSP